MLRLALFEKPDGMLPEFMDGEPGRVENMIRHVADRREQIAFERNRFKNRTIGIERMRTACFAEAILKHVVGRFEEKHDDVQTRAP